MNSPKIVDQLNKLELYKCENVKIGDTIFNGVIWSNILERKNLLRAIFRIIFWTFFCGYKYQIKGIPKTISYCPASSRRDHIKAFDDVMSLIKEQIIFTSAKGNIKLSNIKYIYLPLKWIRQMAKLDCPLYSKLIIASLLYKPVLIHIGIEKLILSKGYNISYFLSYYDVETVSSFLTQKCNANGIKTVTLQHGFFDLRSNSWSYSGSKSNYFLVDSPASAENAKKAGYSGNVIAVGSPHQLNDGFTPLSNNQQKKRIGIIMNASDFGQADNISMVQCLQEYATDENINLILKFHPQNNPEDYSQYIDNDIVNVVDKKESIDDFCKKIDLAIICASTVFTTMLKKGIPVLLFVRAGHDIQLFDKTDTFKFRNAVELKEKMTWVNSTEYRKEYEKFQNYFLCPGNYKENYLRFFKDIGMI